MTPEKIYAVALNCSHYAPVLSILACFWLFFKYIRQMDKGVKYLLVIVLAASDLIYSANHLLSFYWVPSFQVSLFFHLFSMSFSIFWAAAIAFIAYKNLADRYINLKALFIKVLLVVMFLAVARAVLIVWLPHLTFGLFHWAFIPLVISLLLTIVFYQKGINILRDHLQYEQKSISRYIRNLRYFSGVQFLTYGPQVVSNSLTEIFERGVSRPLWIMESCYAFACLSGFLSVVVFACQGGFDSSLEDECDSAAEEDLTSRLQVNP